MTSRTRHDEANWHRIDLPDALASPLTAVSAPQLRLSELGTPKAAAAALQYVALWTNLPVRKPVGRQEPRSVVSACSFVTDRRQSEPFNLQPRLKRLVMNTLIVQESLLDGQLIPSLKASSHHRNRRTVLPSKVYDCAGTITRQNLTPSNLTNRFQCVAPLSDLPSSRTYDAEASTERREFGVGFCPAKRALFPRSAAASAEVRRASPWSCQ